MKIDVLDPMAVSDADLLDVYEIDKAIQLEAKPEVPVRTPEGYVAHQRVDQPKRHRALVLAREGGSLAGAAWISWTVGHENRHLARAHISVAPERRRRGAARELLGALAEHCAADARTLMQSWTSSRAPAGEEFCRAVGAAPGLVTYTNWLKLESLDRELLRGWRAAGEALADYELLTLEPPTPEELLPAVAAIENVMNTAPRDDLREEDETITPDMIAAGQRAYLAGGRFGRMMYVRHRPTGDLVALTQIGWDRHDRTVLGQGDTAVRPDHRGRGLAKWVKATMLLDLIDDIPEARAVVTGNAVSNDGMLAINRAMGFEPVGHWTVWELETEQVLRYTSGQSARPLE